MSLRKTASTSPTVARADCSCTWSRRASPRTGAVLTSSARSRAGVAEGAKYRAHPGNVGFDMPHGKCADRDPARSYARLDKSDLARLGRAAQAELEAFFAPNPHLPGGGAPRPSPPSPTPPPTLPPAPPR